MTKRFGVIFLACVAGIVIVCLLPPLSRHRPASSIPSAEQAHASASSSTPTTPTTSAPLQNSPAAAAEGSSNQSKNAPSQTPAPDVPPIKIPPELQLSPTAAPLDIPPATLVEHMRTSFHLYASMFGGNPVGNNAEITRALLGENPKQANFLKPEAGQRINANGELVDAWGTPYFFHALSGTEMEIRSAGPDKRMYTADDLVMK